MKIRRFIKKRRQRAAKRAADNRSRMIINDPFTRHVVFLGPDERKAVSDWFDKTVSSRKGLQA
jgi:hypothetical protein